MDGAGDFLITWGSFGQDGRSYGVYAQRYSAAGTASGFEFRVNTYTTVIQIASQVAMDAAGDFVIAWMSSGQDGSSYGIYSQRYIATAGPTVVSVLEGPRVVRNGDRLASSIDQLVVNFSDDLNVVSGGSNSVINPSSWRLTRYGVDVSNRITGIVFEFNPSTNLYAAIVSFDQLLNEGAYQLVARQTIQDLTGRALDGEPDGFPGGDFAVTSRSPQR